MNRTKVLLTAKYAGYGLLLLILYVLQTTPGLFELFGAKPMLVVPAAMAIAMHEGEFAGGLYGAFAGLLCDMSGSMLFGFNGLFIALFCIAGGLLVIYLMHCNVWNATFYVTLAMLARGGVEFLFGYGMWGYADVWRVFAYRTLPVAVYTSLITPLLFWVIRKIHGKTQVEIGK